MTHFTSLQHHNVVMEKKVKAGKKDTVMRDTYVTVNKIDPLQCVTVKMESLVQGKKLLPSKSRYKQHWHVDLDFTDSVAWALKIDAGGRSTKGTINPVNVERPQSQNHIMPILEFGGGVKDTDSNMRKACFKKGDMVREGLEVLVQRRGISLSIGIGGNKRIVLVKNTSTSHSRSYPRALQAKLTGTAEYMPEQSNNSQPVQFDERLVEVNVAQVSSIKLLVSTSTNMTHGLCFYDEGGNEIARGLFRLSVKSAKTQPLMDQYLMVGVFTADLEFLSKFLGHQGASARYLCMMCLIVKAQVEASFRSPEIIALPEKRTLEKLKNGGKKYNEMMRGLDEEARSKKRGEVTREHTFSITGEPMADVAVEDGDCSPGSMHVYMGMTKWLVKVKKRALRRLEALEAEARGRRNAPLQFSERIEESVRMCDEYLTFLMERSARTVNAVENEQHLIEGICNQIAVYQQMVNISGNQFERAVFVVQINELKKQLEQAVKARKEISERHIDDECQHLEQIFITREHKKELLTILKKHMGHSARVATNVMSQNGVDENVYHSGSIDGNQCVKYGEKGDAIISQITEEMGKVIKNETNRKYLKKLDTSLKHILALWFKLMKVMKSVERQSLQKIRQFKVDTISLKKLIREFVDEEPVPGTNNEYPTFLKSHLMFDFHIQHFLET